MGEDFINIIKCDEIKDENLLNELKGGKIGDTNLSICCETNNSCNVNNCSAYNGGSKDKIEDLGPT